MLPFFLKKIVQKADIALSMDHKNPQFCTAQNFIMCTILQNQVMCAISALTGFFVRTDTFMARADLYLCFFMRALEQFCHKLAQTSEF